MQQLQALEIQVTTVYHVERSGLHRQDVQHIDIVQLAVADMDECRDRSAGRAA
jgi:hypothetical protein